MNVFFQRDRIFNYVLVIGMAIVFLAVLMVLSGPNATADVNVDQGGNGDYLTIQEGIDNAIPGDNVFVWDGSYTENITIDKSLQLIGNGSATTRIDGFGTMNNIINVTAEGVEITGFNITESGSWYGIWANVGGFNIHDNLFTTQDYAIYVDISRISSGSIIIGDMIVDNNEVNGTDGFYFSIDIRKPLAGSNIIIGQTRITRNKLYDTNTGILLDDYEVRDMSGGSIDWADVVITDNLINSNADEGIDFWGWVINMTDVNIDLGNLDFSGNNITSDVICMNIVSWNTIDLFGTTDVMIQDTTLNNNTIVSLAYNGIVLYTSYYFYIYDIASVTTGDFYINSNNVTALGLNAQGGICIYMIGIGQFLQNDATVDFGNMYIDSNIVTAVEDGILIEITDSGTDIHNNSIVNLGNIIVTNNDINSSKNGVHLKMDNIGFANDGFSSAAFGNFIISDNNITSGENGTYIEMNQVGYDMHEDTSLTMGSFTIESNNVTSTTNGINIQGQSIARNMHDNTEFSIGGFSLNFNMINSTNSKGIEFIIQSSAYTMTGNATATFGVFLFIDNNITAFWDGIYFGVYDLGFDMHDRSVVTMMDIFMNDNIIKCGSVSNVIISDFYNIGVNMYGDSSISLGTWNIEYNKILSGAYGIHLISQNWGNDMEGNSNLVYGDLLILNNDVNVTGHIGIGVHHINVGRNMIGSSSVTGGNLLIMNNIVSSQDQNGLNFIYSHNGYDLYDFSVVSMGWIDISYNNFSSINEYGAFITISNLGCYMNGNSQVYIGDIMFTNNNVSSDTMDALHFYQFYQNAFKMYDDSYFQIGNVLVDDNYFSAGGTGDGIELFQWERIAYELSQNANADLGSFEFNHNTIEAVGSAIYAANIEYWAYYLNGSNHVTMGNLQFNDNNINSTNWGIRINWFTHFGNYMHGGSIFSMGDISFNKNQITTMNAHGMHIERFNDLGRDMYENSAFLMGDITFNENNITSGNHGIAQYSMERYGYNMFDNSIYIMGDIEFNKNRINSSTNGIYGDDFQEWGKYMYGNAVFQIGNVTFDDNEINSTGARGIGHHEFLQHLGYMMQDQSSVHIGDISFSRNTIIAATDGIYIDDLDYWGYDMNGSCMFVIGNLWVNDNVITAGEEGIFHVTFRYHGYKMKVNSSYQMGNVEFLRNTIQSGTDGMILQQYGYWGYDLHGTSTYTMGDILIKNNMINASRNGIYQEQGIWNFFGFWGWSLNDASSYTMGDISFSQNTIEAGNGTYFDRVWSQWGVWLNGSSSFVMGNIMFNENVVNATNIGLYINRITYLGNYMYDFSTFSLGHISFNKNEINTLSSHGLSLDNFNDWGCFMNGNSAFSMGKVTVNENIISSGRNGIAHYGMERYGYNINDNSICMMGDIEFNKNRINSSTNGIYGDDFQEWGKYMFGNAVLHMGNVSFDDNEINSTSAKGITHHEFLLHIGYMMQGGSSVQIGEISFSRNTIIAATDGIYIDDLDYWGYDMNGTCVFVIGDLLINDNVITSGEEGIFHVTFRYHGYNMKVDSSYHMGNVEILRNNILCGTDGIILQQWGYWGYDLSGTSTYTMGNILLNYNIINAPGNGIFYEKSMWNYFGYWGWSLNNASHYTMGDISFSYNTIDAGENGTLLDDWKEWGFWLNGSSSVTIGNIYFNGNIINASEDGLRLVEFSYIGYNMQDNSIFYMGNFEMSSNQINASSDGLELYRARYMGRYIHDNAQVTFMNFLFNDNTITAGRYGIYNNDLEYVAYYTYGTSIITFGNIEFNRNTIISTDRGIYLYGTLTDSGAYLYDSSQAYFGHLQINENDIISDSAGIYYWGIADVGTRLYNQSYFEMGTFEIFNNTVDAVRDGIYVNRIYDVGYFLYNDSTAVFSDFLFTDNIIMAGGHGLYINNFWYAGRYLFSNTSANIGNVIIENNEISAGEQGIYFRYQRCGTQLNENSTVTFGMTQINNNNITAGWNGTFFSALYIGHEMFDDSTFEIGNIEICGNKINASDNGIEIDRIQYLARDMYNNASATFGNFLFNENIIVAGNDGIYNNYMESFGFFMNGNSEATFGNFEFNLNNINSINHGIYLDDTLNDCGYNMRNNTIATFGYVQVNYNNITSGGYGIWYDYFSDNGAQNHDSSYFQWANFEICYNIIDSGDHGIYVYNLYDLGYQLNNDSIAVFGDFLFIDNTITSKENGLHINGFRFNGRYLRSNSSATFGNLEINDNDINASKEGIHLRCELFISQLYGNSTATFGQIQMNANNITSGMTAINFSASYYGQNTFDDCIADVGMIQIDGNDLIAGEKGIEMYFFNVYYEVFNNSYLNFDDIMISNNIISAQTIGIDIQFEDCGDLHHNSTVNIPGIIVMGNTVDSGVSSFNYFTSGTPTNNDPSATQVWGDVILDTNDFNAGIYGVSIEWNDPNSSVSQPVFYILNTDIHDGSGVSTGILLLNITDVYAERVTIDTFDYGIMSNNSNVHHYLNGSIANCAVMDISLYSDSYLFMINSTFDNSSVFFEDIDSLLEVAWFMNVLVQSQVPLPIPDAIVAVADVDGTEIFNGITNADGQALYIICMDYEQNITGIIKNYNDYTANATMGVDFGVASPNPTMNRTRLVIITLVDVTPPTIFGDNSDTSGTTGDPFYFEINATDNMGIVSIHLNYRFNGTGPYINLTMNGSGPYWLNEIIPSDIVGFIEYYFTALDSGGFWVNTTPTTAPISDNDAPTFVWVLQPMNGTTGESVLVSIQAFDNIGITYYRIDVDGVVYDLVKDGDFYNFTLNVPPDSIMDIIYSIILNDSANNPNTIPGTTISISDNDAPSFTWILQPMAGTTGESVLVSIQATDNIGITYYKIDVDGVIYDLVKDGDFYNFTIDVPPDDIADIIYSIIFNDSANNPNTIPGTTITVTDNDVPTYTWVLQPTTGIPGGSVTISLTASDNIGMTNYTVTINGTTYDMVKDGDYYNYTYNIPIDSTLDIPYSVSFMDGAGNLNSTSVTMINIAGGDNEAPTYTWILQPIASTTGESVLVSLSAIDDSAVVYYKIEIDGALYDLTKDGDYYNYTIELPSDSLTDIVYKVIFKDTADNQNDTLETTLTITDNDDPTNLIDNSDPSATTGDLFTFVFDASDNIGLAEAGIFYWFGTGTASSEVISGSGPFTYSITVPSDSLDELHYYVVIKDAAGNSIPGPTMDVGVMDNDIPFGITDTSDTTATTGDDFIFNVNASDNIGIVEMEIYYWFGDGEETNISLTGSGPFTHTISLPGDSTDTLHYYFVFIDAADNELIGSQVDVTLVDDDKPTISNDQTDVSVEIGEDFNFQIDASDNIGVSQVRVAYWFGEDDTQKQFITLTDDNGTYSGSFKPAESGTLNYYFELTDSAGNIHESSQQSAQIASEPKEEEEEPTIIPWLLIILIIIVIIIFFFLMSKKGKEEEAIPKEEEEAEKEPEGEVMDEDEDIEVGTEGELSIEEGFDEGEEVEQNPDDKAKGEVEDVSEPEIVSEEPQFEEEVSEEPSTEETADEIDKIIDEVSDKDDI